MGKGFAGRSNSVSKGTKDVEKEAWHDSWNWKLTNMSQGYGWR